MLFATPLWLLALIPWAALAAWMLWGRRERVNVPFLALWRGGDARPSVSRQVQAPPLPIVLLLLAILLAILAAGSPTRSAAGVSPVTIIVDRGITMSARDGDAYRYAAALAAVTKQLGDSRVHRVVTLPAGEWAGAAAGAGPEFIPPTAVDTSADVEQAVLRALRGGHEPLVVITDRPINVTDPRLIVVAPTPLNANAGIAHVAARETPEAQVMVRLTSQPPSKRTVTVTSNGERVERTVDAPGTAFVDVGRLGRTVQVSLSPGDALEGDDRAWLAREGGWPRIEAAAALPAELARMIETYRKLRPPRGDARVISVVDAPEDAAGEAVILAPASTDAAGAPAPTIADHPVTVGVAWAEVLEAARVGAAPPAGFTPLLVSEGGVAVAVRETPVRQVWVALESTSFPRSADFVVFWTNVFDWLGRGGDVFAAHPVALLGDAWRRVTDGPSDTEGGLWPGLYERSDGTLRAVNAPPVVLPAPQVAEDWRQRLSRLPARGAAGHSLGPYLLLAALVCALGAAARWPARRAAST